ncbi:MAG: hypothetical protein ABL886_12515, partial [Rhodoglobus sp.]
AIGVQQVLSTSKLPRSRLERTCLLVGLQRLSAPLHTDLSLRRLATSVMNTHTHPSSAFS